jgi:immune inhibitor A
MADLSTPFIVASYPERCSAPPHPEVLSRWRHRHLGAEGAVLKLLAPLLGDDVPLLANGRPRGRGDGVIYPAGQEPPARAGLALSAPGAPAVPRTVRAIVVAAEFADVKLTKTVAYLKDLFFSTGRTVATGSVREYYEEVSRGAVVLDGDVIGPVTVPNTLAYYANHAAGQAAAPPNAQSFAADVLAAVGARAYAPYDNDGDGFVDAFIIVHAGRGAERTGSKGDLWSLKWILNGAPVSGTDGVKVYGFLTVPEDTPVGIAAHELGHLLFGLPDLYDLSSRTNGIGNWCLMAGGCWNDNGDTPAHPSAWCKMKLGWTDRHSIAAPAAVSFGPNGAAGGQTLDLAVNGSEYYLAEHRKKTGFDGALPGEGLLIWHIDETRPENRDPDYRVTLVQADGVEGPLSGTDGGDDGDPYPGSTLNTAFDAHSTPPQIPHTGASTVAITNIAASPPNVTADCTP